MKMASNHLDIQIPGELQAVSIVAGRNDGLSPGGGGVKDHPGASADSRGLVHRQMEEQAKSELAALCLAKTALESAAGECHKAREKIIEQTEGQLLDLSIEIARKVLMQEIQAQRYEIEPIVREALSRIPDRMEVMAHLHPDDLSRCELTGQDQADSVRTNIQFIADPGVKRGECLLETSEGTVKSTVEEHLAEITKTLKSPE